MSDSNGIGELAAALAKAQAKMPVIPKTRTANINSAKGSYSYRYADLSDILQAATPVLSEQGLAVSQTFAPAGETGLVLESTLLHASGASLRSVMPLDWSGGSPQALGSIITYMRRYSYCALVGITSDDDDDAQAGEREAAPAKPAQKPAPKPVTSHGSPVGGKVANDKICTDAQRKMIWAATMGATDRLGIDKATAEEGLRRVLADLNIESTARIPFKAVDTIKRAIEAWTLETFAGEPPEDTPMGLESGDGADVPF